MYATKAYTTIRIVQQMNTTGATKSEEEHNMDMEIEALEAAVEETQDEIKLLSANIPKLREKMETIANLKYKLEEVKAESDLLRQEVCDLEKEFASSDTIY